MLLGHNRQTITKSMKPLIKDGIIDREQVLTKENYVTYHYTISEKGCRYYGTTGDNRLPKT